MNNQQIAEVTDYFKNQLETAVAPLDFYDVAELMVNLEDKIYEILARGNYYEV